MSSTLRKNPKKTKRPDEADDTAVEAEMSKKARKPRAPNHKWTDEQDVALLRGIRSVGAGRWKDIFNKIRNDHHADFSWCEEENRLRARWGMIKTGKTWIDEPAPQSNFTSPPGMDDAAKEEAERKAAAELAVVRHRWEEARRLVSEIKDRASSLDDKPLADEKDAIKASVEKEEKRAKELEDRRAAVQKAADEDTAIRRKLADHIGLMQESNAAIVQSVAGLTQVIGLIFAQSMGHSNLAALPGIQLPSLAPLPKQHIPEPPK